MQSPCIKCVPVQLYLLPNASSKKSWGWGRSSPAGLAIPSQRDVQSRRTRPTAVPVQMPPPRIKPPFFLPSRLWFLLVAAAAGLSCFTTASIVGATPLTVASLSTVLSDFARQVGGDRVRVLEIVRSGVDPHQFEPSPGDVQRVAGADLVLVSGKGLEGYLSKLEQSAGQEGKFIDVGAKLPSQTLQQKGKAVPDPHWWHNVENAKRSVTVLAAAFSAAEPADRETFENNAAAARARLDRLEGDLKMKVAELGRDRRKLVTSHDAFGYFAREFGFSIYPIEGVTTSDQPSAKKVAELVDTIRAERVKAVFFENIENPKVIAEITRETGAKVGGELYADGLGAPGTDAATYAGMMRHNVNTIVDALK
jgi:zinc/manganese transport system substrate-binding protein